MSEDESRFGRYLGYTAAIIAILAVLVPTGIWVADHLRSTPPNSQRNDDPAVLSPATGATQTNSVPGGAVVYLAGLTPDTGGEFLGTLPRALAGQPAYAHALTLPCPTNQTGDMSHAVTYLLHGHYQSLHADLRPYLKTNDESQVEFTVYPDNALKADTFVSVDSSQQIDVDIDGIQKLTIWIGCDSADATAILADAYLVHN